MGADRPPATSRAGRPFVLLSVAVSIDGYIDDTADERLLLSNEADFDRVDELRAWADAVLVGAETVRRDNPRLLVKDEGRRRARVAAGKPEYPRKVTVTAAGDLDPAARFWHHGTAEHPPLVYTTESGARRLTERLLPPAEDRLAASAEHRSVASTGDRSVASAGDCLAAAAQDRSVASAGEHSTAPAEERPVVPSGERPVLPAEIVVLGAELEFGALLDDLAARGIERLMVEGGGRIHTAFLAAGLADELHLAVGPTLVGDPQAPRFLYPAAFPGGSTHRMSLLGVSQLGDVAVLRYRPQEARCPNPTTITG
ncbi:MULTISPECIES: RibD family protein [Nocardia]|uniref:RibD family protein n=1 Tax=Nocardia TaxID=1817 RepID=UPI001895EE19|nr:MULTISPECIES: dihydrofolate reductase family protein [Nocardia]MBF6352482.1 dihydrofolate reductase family protein [Nocardia flavorosea]